MAQIQLTCQIAKITGEPTSTVNRLGFCVIPDQPDSLEPEDFKLVLDCPFCGLPVSFPGLASDGSDTLAECDRCDIYFGFDVDEVYALPVKQQVLTAE